MKSKRLKILLGVLSAVILASAAYFVYTKYFQKDKSDTGILSSVKKEKKAICPLDGLSVNEAVANRHPLAIMIENHTDARPQVGLSEASLIYEAIAEGGITRFMAVYVWGESEKVGPVRSARIYYVDWAEEFNVFYAHVGGNWDALEKIKAENILDLDQFKYGTQAYWREAKAGKATEHTMFTSTKKLWSIAEKNKWDMTGSYPAFDFKDDPDVSQRPQNTTTTINFSTANYQVKWIYDNSTNSYTRNQVNTPEIKAKNIIAQWVDRKATETKINESGWNMTVVGSGKAQIFLDGKVIEGTWKKDSRTSRTYFFDSSGQKIKFNRGQTWIEIVHNDTPVSTK